MGPTVRAVTSSLRACLATGCAFVALAGCGGTDSPAAASVDAENVLLRLSDLGAGYRVGDDSGCGAGVEGAPSDVAQVVREHRPRACVVQFEQVWKSAPAEPSLVESAAYVFDDEDGARDGFRAGNSLARYAFALEPGIREQTPRDTIGDETLLLTAAGDEAVVWRSGSVIGLVFVRGGRERLARGLASRQQERIEKPSPASPEAESDAEVVLDNPQLGIDVWWLGRSFAPGGGLPPLTLADAVGPLAPGGGPGNVLKIDYRRATAGAGGVTLDIWRRDDWERFTRTQLGRLVWRSPCSEAERRELRDGYAIVYGGYATSAEPPPPSVEPMPSSGSQRRPRAPAPSVRSTASWPTPTSETSSSP